MILNKSKIYQILNVLTKKERKKLLNVFSSKQNHNHLKLAKNLFDFIDNKISISGKEELYQIIFPGQIFEDTFFRLLMSDVVSMAEDILVMSHLEKDKNRYHYYLLKAINERELERFATPAIEEFEARLEKSTLRDASFHELFFMLEEEKYKLQQNKSRDGYNFTNMSKHLDYYFISERLRISSLIATHDKILKKNHDSRSLSELLDYLVKNPHLLEIPAIRLFYNSYQLIIHPEKEEENLDTLTDSIFEYSNLFQKDVLKDMLLIAINFCISKMNSGNKEFDQKAFNLYLQGMDKNLLLEKGNLTRYTLKNIITLGIRLNQYEWSEKFIHENIHLIEKKFREGTLAYSLGYLAFEMKDYDKAARLLRDEASHDDQLLHLAAKNLLMKVYYLQNEINLLELLIGSLNSYLKRRKLGGEHFENYTNILHVMRKLIIIKQLPKTANKSMLKKIEDLQILISKTSPLTERKWFLEQCKDLAQAH